MAYEYSKIEALSSVIMESQLIMAPDITPENIIGVVTLKNVLKRLAPKLIDASSTLKSICLRIAAELLMVYGNLLITYAMTMIINVPLKAKGFLLKARSNAIPNTAPGMIYGNIEIRSKTDVSLLFLLTEVYAITTPITITMAIAIRE